MKCHPYIFPVCCLSYKTPFRPTLWSLLCTERELLEPPCSWLCTRPTAEGDGFAVLTCSSSGRPRQQRTPCQQWQSNSRRSAGLNPGWRQKQREYCAAEELLRLGNTKSQAGFSGRNFQGMGSHRPPCLPLGLSSSLPALIQEVLGQGACYSLKRGTKEQPGFPPSLPFSGKQMSLHSFFNKNNTHWFLPSPRPRMQEPCQELGSPAKTLSTALPRGIRSEDAPLKPQAPSAPPFHNNALQWLY